MGTGCCLTHGMGNVSYLELHARSLCALHIVPCLQIKTSSWAAQRMMTWLLFVMRCVRRTSHRCRISGALKVVSAETLILRMQLPRCAHHHKPLFCCLNVPKHEPLLTDHPRRFRYTSFLSWCVPRLAIFRSVYRHVKQYRHRSVLDVVVWLAPA